MNSLKSKLKYALIDDEGQPIRYFDYPAEGTVPVPEEPKMTYSELMDKFGEATL
jgi:hypothetical protein